MEPTLEERVAELEQKLELLTKAMEYHNNAIKEIIAAGKLMNDELTKVSQKANHAYSFTQVIG